MRILFQVLLHGLCGIAGFWLVSASDQAAPPGGAVQKYCIS